VQQTQEVKSNTNQKILFNLAEDGVRPKLSQAQLIPKYMKSKKTHELILKHLARGYKKEFESDVNCRI